MSPLRRLGVIVGTLVVLVTGTAGAADAAFIGKPRSVPYYHCHLDYGLFGLNYYCHTATT